MSDGTEDESGHELLPAGQDSIAASRKKENSTLDDSPLNHFGEDQAQADHAQRQGPSKLQTVLSIDNAVNQRAKANGRR